MLGSFNKIKNTTLKKFSSLIEEDVYVVNPASNANFPSSSKYSNIWKIKTGLYDDEKSQWLIEDITIYIAFPSIFPLVPPKIFYDKNDFEKIGYIPHTSFLLNDICVYDNYVIVDENRPEIIIYETYNDAKRTLIDGLKGDNQNHYNEEFIAYWESKSNLNDSLLKEDVFSIIENEPKTNELGVLFYSYNQSLKSNNNGIIIFNKEENYVDNYRNYFKENGIHIKEMNAFYIDDDIVLNKPPFAINFEESLKLIEKNLQSNFKKYFLLSTKKIVVFKKEIGNQKYYLGWFYPKININIRGFRRSSLDEFSVAFRKSFSYHKKNVIRFSAERLNENRLFNRTASDRTKKYNYKLMVAGVGSVGSNLIPLLNSFNNPNLTLVDNDNLASENIKRHFLGFKDLGCNKAIAIKRFLNNKLPSQNVTAITNSFYDYYQNNFENILSNDYIFFCLGNINLDKWIINEIYSGKLKVPIFILWVEPYLLGGQLLYLHPSEAISANNLFSDIYKYKYSIIDPNEFENKRDLFTLKELGCQSSYSPYSSTHLAIFINSVFNKIFSIIDENSENSQIYSWVGDISIATDLSIKLRRSDFQKYTLFKNKL